MVPNIASGSKVRSRIKRNESRLCADKNPAVNHDRYALMPAARPSQPMIAKALAAWSAAGLRVGRMTIRDGAVIIETPEVAGITEKADAASAYDAWRARKSANG